ncbi:glycosyltransferase family 4 protein [Candidatus Woesearchaeota archaeon]|nr:glycosyltransferase family 4 protein [Candidatus Woesearchaeota archaeon]
MEKKNLAVIASRLKCVDAISVDAENWINKFVNKGYNVHLIAGKFGEPVNLPIFELHEMDYKHPEVRGVKSIMFSSKLDKQGRKAADILIDRLVKRIKGPLKNYLVKNKIEVLCIEDALGSLKNVPLNIALTQIVSELGLPTISHYHYLHWINPYFAKFNNFPKITNNLPPKLKNITHITNTENARLRLLADKRVSSSIIPNTIDTDKLSTIDDYNSDFRKALGINDDQLIFLQPTRVKRNKYVERSIKLVAEINDITKKDNVLLITGSPIYSRGNYFEEIVRKMNKQGVKIIFANDRVFMSRHQNSEQKFYSIHDAYLHSDVVIYPTAGDAFGNPIIESVAYRKPLVVNNFSNLNGFLNKGFKFVVMDQKVDAEVVSDTYQLITDNDKRQDIVEHNYNLLKKHYSSDVLDEALMPILKQIDEQKSLMSRVAGIITPWNRKRKDIKDPDLKNKKGGYKEPNAKKK